ncbi:MAG: hypothetical protein AB8H47_29350 [Bacteroidia bacterium]
MGPSFKVPFLIIALIAMGTVNLMFLKTTPDMRSMIPELRVNASNIYRSFCEDEGQARQLYVDKIMEVSGLLRSVEKTPEGNYSLTMDFEGSMGYLRCDLSEEEYPDLARLRIGEVITVKGFFREYLFEVMMDQSIVIN